MTDLVELHVEGFTSTLMILTPFPVLAQPPGMIDSAAKTDLQEANLEW